MQIFPYPNIYRYTYDQPNWCPLCSISPAYLEEDSRQTNHSSFVSTMAQACTLLVMRVGPSIALLLQKKSRNSFFKTFPTIFPTQILLLGVYVLQTVRWVRAHLHVRLRATPMQVVYPHNACACCVLLLRVRFNFIC